MVGFKSSLVPEHLHVLVAFVCVSMYMCSMHTHVHWIHTHTHTHTHGDPGGMCCGKRHILLIVEGTSKGCRRAREQRQL